MMCCQYLCLEDAVDGGPGDLDSAAQSRRQALAQLRLVEIGEGGVELAQPPLVLPHHKSNHALRSTFFASFLDAGLATDNSVLESLKLEELSKRIRI